MTGFGELGASSRKRYERGALCDEPAISQPLTASLVITIEPIISAGTGAVYQSQDGWTIKTPDGPRSAHVEHTVVITDHVRVLITA